MYDKELETNREAKRAHDAVLKKRAAERLAANAKWNKENRPKKGE